MTPAQRQLPGVLAVHRVGVHDMSKGNQYAKVLTGGRPINPTRADEPTDTLTRLGSRVVVMGECWVVDGQPDTYPSAGNRQRRASAHRYVYGEVHEVTLPSNVHIHHICEHAGCIRPCHLVALDASDHGRVHAGSASLDDVVIPPSRFH